MFKYLLAYEQPRLSLDGGKVDYQIRRVSLEWANDAEAIRWTREVVPRAYGLTHAGTHYPAHPIELRQGRLIIWRGRR
jgi:hypothetical protein